VGLVLNLGLRFDGLGIQREKSAEDFPNLSRYGRLGEMVEGEKTRRGLRRLLPRDLRRNVVRAGVYETVAMAVAGYSNWRVFQWYNITSTADLSKAMDKVSKLVVANCRVCC
jgi:hypothetical protein